MCLALKASIRPRRWRRGEHHLLVYNNSAAGMLQFGRGVGAVENVYARSARIPRTRFNSATALAPWRTVMVQLSGLLAVVLQFGHGVGAVENGSVVRTGGSGWRSFNSAT